MNMISLSGAMVMEWYDPRFTWNPSAHGGLQILHLPYHSVWKPDIYVYFGNSVENLQERDNFMVRLRHNGETLLELPFRSNSLCPIDVKLFPFDKQHCHVTFVSKEYSGMADYNKAYSSLRQNTQDYYYNFSGDSGVSDSGNETDVGESQNKSRNESLIVDHVDEEINTGEIPNNEKDLGKKFQFGSWSYVENFVEFRANPEIDLENFYDNQEWILYNQTVALKTIESKKAGNFSAVRLWVHISRQPFYYIFNLVIPATVITVTSIVGIHAPNPYKAARAAKFQLGIVTLLPMGVLLLTIVNDLPKFSLSARKGKRGSFSGVPLLGIYYLCLLITISLCTVTYNIFVTMEWYAKTGYPVPGILRPLITRRRKANSNDNNDKTDSLSPRDTIPAQMLSSCIPNLNDRSSPPKDDYEIARQKKSPHRTIRDTEKSSSFPSGMTKLAGYNNIDHSPGDRRRLNHGATSISQKGGLHAVERLQESREDWGDPDNNDYMDQVMNERMRKELMEDWESIINKLERVSLLFFLLLVTSLLLLFFFHSWRD